MDETQLALEIVKTAHGIELDEPQLSLVDYHLERASVLGVINPRTASSWSAGRRVTARPTTRFSTSRNPQRRVRLGVCRGFPRPALMRQGIGRRRDP